MPVQDLFRALRDRAAQVRQDRLEEEARAAARRNRKNSRLGTIGAAAGATAAIASGNPQFAPAAAGVGSQVAPAIFGDDAELNPNVLIQSGIGYAAADAQSERLEQNNRLNEAILADREAAEANRVSMFPSNDFDDSGANVNTGDPMLNMLRGENLSTINPALLAQLTAPPALQTTALGTGQRLVDQTGRTIVPATGKGKGLTAAQKLRNQKISDVRNLYGLGEAEAVAVVDGHAKITPTQQGQLFYVNEASRETQQLTPSKSTPEGVSAFLAAAAQKDGPTLYEAAEDSAGVINSFKEAYSEIAGQAGLPIYGKTVRGRAMFRQATQELIRVLTNNPRFPVGEADRIRESIRFEPSYMDSPEALRERQAVLDQTLDRIGRKQLSISQRADIPLADQAAAKQTYVDIENFREHLGVLRDRDLPPEPTANPGTVIAADKLQSLPKSIQPEAKFAYDSIKAGGDAKKIRARFKERTGKDLP
jgi:hypothetical protein